MNKIYIGNRLEKLLKDLKISKKELADSIEVSEKSINDISLGLYEKDDLSDMLKKMINFYNIDKKYFSKPSIPKRKKVNAIEKPAILSNVVNFEPPFNECFFTLEELKQLPVEKTIIYKNKGLIYELKNKDKTIICSYCGKPIKEHIVSLSNVFSICEYQCSCSEFVKASIVSTDNSLTNQIFKARIKNGYETFLKKFGLVDEFKYQNIYNKAMIFMEVIMIYKNQLQINDLI